jgi:hypothetical protein
MYRLRQKKSNLRVTDAQSPLQPQMVPEGVHKVIYPDDYWMPFAPH